MEKKEKCCIFFHEFCNRDINPCVKWANVKPLKTNCMEPFLVGILVPLGAFAMIFGIFYIVITSRNRERMALIERGADPTLFEARKKASTCGSMKIGLFLFGIGLGIVVAYLFSSGGGMEEGAAYPAMIFVFGGLALIVSHLWQRKQEKEDELKR
jgi:hypothetical protein